MIEKKVGNEWVTTQMSDLLQGEEFRYDGDPKVHIAASDPFMNDDEWTVEVEDER